MGRIFGERAGRAPWRQYGAAFFAVALAGAATIALQQWLFPTPLAPFFCAVALAAWYGGLGPALLAIALSVPTIAVWALPPDGIVKITWIDVEILGTFVVVSLVISALSASRDRAEMALRTSERRFRTMLETANEGVWLIDRQGRTQYANDRMAALLGATPEQIRSGTVLDFVFPEDLAAARQRIETNLAGVAEEFDFRFRRADGEEALVLAGTSPVRDDAGRVVGALGLYTDVTARNAAADALRLLEDSGRALASSLDYEQTLRRVAWLAVPALADWCVVDLLEEDGTARRVAVAHSDTGDAELAERLLAYAPAASGDGPDATVLRSGESVLVTRVSDVDVAAAEGEEPLSLLRGFGVVSVMAVPLRAGGGVHGAMTLATSTSGRVFDDDDLALAEQLGRRSAVAILNARLYRDAQAAEARYRGLFAATKDGIIVCDPDGHCLDVNPALTEMVGYAPAELIGVAASQVACGGPWSGEERERLRRDGEWRGEFELRHRSGARVPVESWITTALLPSGPVHVGVLRDVSERRRLEEAQEEFLSALAHDLKNPLTTVRGQTQLLRRRIARGEPPDAARLDAGLESIDVASSRMARLLDELADIMRLRAGQGIDLNREPTDLVALVRRTVAEHDPLSERHAITLEAEAASLAGNWDGPRLERVLTNLLGNAIKYSPRGGAITVRVAGEGSGADAAAILSVSDEGVGIPAADQPRIFERFRRAGNVESFAGSGIGLAGAKRIVELHGGTIAVTSAEGEGSTFTVRLPLGAER
jgi:PAS domain S-box-containing protein